MYSYYFGGALFVENVFIVDVSFSPYNSLLNWEVMIIMSILRIQMAREVQNTFQVHAVKSWESNSEILRKEKTK